MKPEIDELIASCKTAALEVLLHNAEGPFQGLPRTAGWGYPEPYTRDLMFSILGVAVSGNQKLIASFRNVLQTLAQNQTEKGHIPSLVHDSDDLGASDTTPLFLLGVGIFRQLIGTPDFLKDAVDKALLWMEYQSPTGQYLVAQQPTSDWRDEQWVMGYGLFVNTLVYSYLRLFGIHNRADSFHHEMQRFTITEPDSLVHSRKGPAIEHRPYYALWTYKIYSSERFDLLGNSLAILSGIASPSRAKDIIGWVEMNCSEMREIGELTGDLPPNFFPYIRHSDPDWRERYEHFNLPGEYHNGGIWPFISALYVAALVAAKHYDLAENKLVALSIAIKKTRESKRDFGFNEWLKAQDGKPMGQDWQTWSAALYLYAVKCVELRDTPFFDTIRENSVG